jgi:hypothetical protein
MSSDPVGDARPGDGAVPATESGGGDGVMDAGATDAASATGDSGPASPAARSERERTFARRALIQAGWSVPVITGLVFPRRVSASGSHPFIDHHDFVDRNPFP